VPLAQRGQGATSLAYLESREFSVYFWSGAPHQPHRRRGAGVVVRHYIRPERRSSVPSCPYRSRCYRAIS